VDAGAGAGDGSDDELGSNFDDNDNHKSNHSEPDAFIMPMDIDLPPATDDPNAGAYMHPELQRRPGEATAPAVPDSAPSAPVNIIDYTPVRIEFRGSLTALLADARSVRLDGIARFICLLRHLFVASSLFDARSLGMLSTSLNSAPSSADLARAESIQLPPLPESAALHTRQRLYSPSASPVRRVGLDVLLFGHADTTNHGADPSTHFYF
jgi:hypothetical protein